MPRLEHSLKVEAVVLRHADWGEADRMLTIYSREHGKLRVLAKGVRRLRSRKAGHLEPFTRVALMLARGRDLLLVTQADTVDAYLPLHEDLVRTGYAAYVIELLDRFTYEEGANRSLYQLLTETLQRLCNETDGFLTARYYEVRLLDELGFRPQLMQCARCGQEIKPQDQFFSAELGGVLCPNCGVNAPATRPVSMDALRFLRHFQRSNYMDARRAVLTPQVRAELEALMNFYLTYLLERGLNSPAFLREMRNNAYRAEQGESEA
jgi:DNA repair protein RecO (recombination protein O)